MRRTKLAALDIFCQKPSQNLNIHSYPGSPGYYFKLNPLAVTTYHRVLETLKIHLTFDIVQQGPQASSGQEGGREGMDEYRRVTSSPPQDIPCDAKKSPSLQGFDILIQVNYGAPRK